MNSFVIFLIIMSLIVGAVLLIALNDAQKVTKQLKRKIYLTVENAGGKKIEINLTNRVSNDNGEMILIYDVFFQDDNWKSLQKPMFNSSPN